MLMDVYIVEELDKIDDWIEKIVDDNKVMGTLHTQIHRLKDQAQEQILEAEKLYSDVCLDIFEDEERVKLFPIEVMVENFRKVLVEASNDGDIRQAFRAEEVLMELDTKLGDFAETWIEVDNYRQKVKDKYQALNLLYSTKITKMIEKFKGKHLNIALG